MFKHVKNQKGLSMAESVLSVGLLGFALLGFYRLNDMTGNHGEESQILSELTNFKIEFYSTLNSARACKQTFASLQKADVGQDVMTDFILRDSTGTPIVTSTPLQIVDQDSYPSIVIEAVSVRQTKDNEVRVIYNIENPAGASFAAIQDVRVNYDLDGNFTHCENDETRTNAALCDSVSGEYNAIMDKCEFFNLAGGNYSAQQCEGLGGEILLDEETGKKYCNKGSDWYRTKTETTVTNRTKTVSKIVAIYRREVTCTTTSENMGMGNIVQTVVCPDIPNEPQYNPSTGYNHMYRNVIGITEVNRSEGTDSKIQEHVKVTAFKSVITNDPTGLPPANISFDPSNIANFTPPSGYTVSSEYYRSPYTSLTEDLNLGLPESEVIFEKIYAETRYRDRIEFFAEMPEHIKRKIELASGVYPQIPDSPTYTDTHLGGNHGPTNPPTDPTYPSEPGDPTNSPGIPTDPDNPNTPYPGQDPMDTTQPTNPPRPDMEPDETPITDPTNLPPMEEEDPNNPENPPTSGPPVVNFMDFFISSAHAGGNHHKPGTKRYKGMRLEPSKYSCISDQPLKHLLPGAMDGDQITTSVVDQLQQPIPTNTRVYYEVHFRDIITEEKIEREQTVYH